MGENLYVALLTFLGWGFPLLYFVILAALSGHFLGNILTGRAKRRFGKEWAWPHHDSHPPALPKVLHFMHVSGMIALAITGTFFLHDFPKNPAFAGWKPAMLWVHYIAMFIVTINLFWRLWYAFVSKQRDYREFAITKRDITTMLQVVMYYIFVKPSKPHLGKYNVMQKATYIMFVPLLFAQAITGFAIWRPVAGGAALAAVLVGANGIKWLKFGHFIISWLFIIITTIHVYLSVTEDFPAFMDFFGIGFLNKHANHGDDEHGDADHGDVDHAAAIDAEPAALDA